MELVVWMNKVSRWAGGPGYGGLGTVEPFPINIATVKEGEDPYPSKFGMKMVEADGMWFVLLNGHFMDTAKARGLLPIDD